MVIVKLRMLEPLTNAEHNLRGMRFLFVMLGVINNRTPETGHTTCTVVRWLTPILAINGRYM